MNNSLLNRVLTFDIWASVTTAIAVTAGAGLIAGWLDISAWIPAGLGVVLIPWVWLLTNARRDPVQSRDVMAVIVGNVTFGVAAVAVVFGFPDALPTSGRWAVAIFGLLTVDLGLTEWMGLRRLSSLPKSSQVAIRH